MAMGSMFLTGRFGISNACCIMVAFLFWAGLFVSLPTAFGKNTDRAEALLESAGQCRKALEASPKKKSYRHHWLTCIDRYKKVYTTYPKSSQAAWALYRSAALYVGLFRYSGLDKDLDEAVALYRQLIDGHKEHSLADDAQYKIGEIFYSLAIVRVISFS